MAENHGILTKPPVAQTPAAASFPPVSTAMPSLLIADDHPLFRAALRQAASEAMSDLQVREAESLDGVLAALDAAPDTDLILLDLHMPGNHGLAGLAAIRAQHPGVAVIVVSANDDPRVVRRALDHGAAGAIAVPGRLSRHVLTARSRRHPSAAPRR